MPKVPINLYNAHGSRLVSKVRNSLNEVVRVESDFGKTLTEVRTTFDKKGRPLKRVIEKSRGKKNVERTVFKYEGIYDIRRKTIIDRFINGRKVQKIIKSEVLKKEDGRNFLTRLILSLTPDKKDSRAETQIIEELSTHKHRRYIKTTARRNEEGLLSAKTIEGNVKHLKQLAKLPYLYFRGYNLKDFLMSISHYAKVLQKVPNRQIDVFFASLSPKVSANSSSIDGFGFLTFDMSKLKSQSRIVDAVNHEYRHQYQESLIEKFEEKGTVKSFLRRLFHPFKFEYAKKCKFELENYISSEVDEKKYLQQFMELDARAAGSKARDEFLAETRLLDKLFPYSKELFTGNDEFFKQVTPI